MARGKAISSQGSTAAHEAMLRRTMALEVLDLPDRSRERTAAMARLQERCGLSRSSAFSLVQRVYREGAVGATRKRRSDAGQIRFDARLQQAWIDYATHPDRHHWTVEIKAERFERQWRRDNDQFPSTQTLRRWLAEADPAYGLTTRELEQRRKRFLRMEAAYPNHVWQADQHQADFVCVERTVDPQTGEVNEQTFRPLLFSFVDVFSGGPIGARYFRGSHTAYSTDVVQATLLEAIYPDPEHGKPFGGTPEIIYWDNGKPHRSEWMARAAASLGIDLQFSRPKDPTAHGFIEGYHNLLINSFEKLQAGYGGSSPTDKPLGVRLLEDREIAPPALMTLDEANTALEAWLPALCEQSYNGGLSRRVRWQANVSPERRAIPDPAQLATAWMRREERRVSGGAIQIFSQTYWAEGLGDYDGLAVEVRYVNTDLRRLYVYHDGRYVAMAVSRRPEVYGAGSNRAALEAQRRELSATKRALRQSKAANAAAAAAGLVASAAAAETRRALEQTERVLRSRDGLAAVAAMGEPQRQMEMPDGVVRLVPKPETRELTVTDQPAPVPDPDTYLLPLDGGQADDDEPPALALDYL